MAILDVYRWILFLSVIMCIETGKVLFLPQPWFSLINRNVVIAEALSKYGHNSTIVTSTAHINTLPAQPYIQYITAESFNRYSIAKGKSSVDLFQNMCEVNHFDFEFLKYFVTEIKIFCKLLLEDNDLHVTLKKGNFDAAVIESTVCVDVFAYNLSLPRIYAAVPYVTAKWRIPFMPSVTKPTDMYDFPNKMTFLQRLINTAMSLFLILPINEAEVTIPSTFAPGVAHKTVEELLATHELVLIDSDPILDFAVPTMPNTPLVGGLSTREPRPLQEPFKSFMDLATDGVIIVAFGSAPYLLPQWKLQVFITAFKKTPKMKFVFKNGDSIVYDGNVMMSPWLPQNDLLAHPNTKAFITHCGNNGQYEALYNAVPMIGVPLYADQFHNAQRIFTKGFGIILKFCTVSEEEIQASISEIMDVKYKRAIEKASRMFHSIPMKPNERAAFWIDHVMKYGGEHLQPPYLPFYQYYLLDVLAFFCLIGVLNMLLFVWVCNKCCRKCLKQKKKQD